MESLLASDMFCEAAAVLRSMMNTTMTPFGAGSDNNLCGDGGVGGGRETGLLLLQGPPSSRGVADQQDLDEQVRGGRRGGEGEGRGYYLCTC